MCALFCLLPVFGFLIFEHHGSYKNHVASQDAFKMGNYQERTIYGTVREVRNTQRKTPLKY